MSYGSYATSLLRAHKPKEAKIILKKLMDKARPKFGDHEAFFRLIESYCLSVRNLSCDGDVTEDEFLNASKMLEDAIRRSRRIFGAAHPQTKHMEENLVILQNWKIITQVARANEARMAKEK